MKEQINAKKPSLQEATEHGLWLTDNCLQNKPTKSLVDKRLNDVQKDIDELKENLEGKKAKLELMLYEKQNYELSMDHFMGWCVSIDKKLRKQEPVSLRYGEIVNQQRNLQVSEHTNNN